MASVKIAELTDYSSGPGREDLATLKCLTHDEYSRTARPQSNLGIVPAKHALLGRKGAKEKQLSELGVLGAFAGDSEFMHPL